VNPPTFGVPTTKTLDTPLAVGVLAGVGGVIAALALFTGKLLAEGLKDVDALKKAEWSPTP
jgi:hypothetical protein